MCRTFWSSIKSPLGNEVYGLSCLLLIYGSQERSSDMNIGLLYVSKATVRSALSLVSTAES